MSVTSRNHDGRTVHDRRAARVALDTIGPSLVDGVNVLIRPARFSDGPNWRRVRLADTHRLRPAMAEDGGSGGSSWDQQSSLTAWVEHIAYQRAATRAGTLVPFLVSTTDDQVLGECTFAIDLRSGLAELSLWAASTASHAVTRWSTANGVLQVLEDPRAVPFVIAPVAVTNPGPAKLLALAGFEPSGTARQLRLHDGVPTDHVIWRLENSAAARSHLRALALEA